MGAVLASGYLSIDAIDAPFGRREHVPGGAALYAALGARHAGAPAAICACVGEDYPQEWLDAIAGCGVAIERIERRPGPTRRARLVHASSGERRSDRPDLWWERTVALAPPNLATLAGFGAIVACPMPIDSLEALVAGATASGVPLVADASEAFAASSRERLLALLPALQAFAPSREETRLLYPELGDDEAALALARLGPCVLQKRGSDGAFAVERGGGSAVLIPAPPTQVCDPTGAGDAVTGALTAALAGGATFLDGARAALTAGARAVSGIGPAALGLDLAPREPEVLRRA